MKPKLSDHFESIEPSAIRLAQIEFMKREDSTVAISTAVGNISLPMHPAMRKRMFNLNAKGSPFEQGVVKYSTTVGYKETNDAFLNVLASSGFDTKGLYSQITDGGSQAMELIILGVSGAAGSKQKPVLLIDPAFTNYKAMALRLGRSTISVTRDLGEDGKYTMPDIEDVQKEIEKHKPGAIVLIPYDNPTGHFYDQKTMVKLAKLCTEHNMWVISDEVYRELHYVDHDTVSIWGVTEDDVPGITGRRISIETASKVWNACGLRTGAIVTDNKMFNQQCVAENTANLCSNVIGQYIFGALAGIDHKELKEWYVQQRDYYFKMLKQFTSNLKKLLPGIIVSSPDASIYSVVDVRNIVKPGFDAHEFVMYCAREGKVDMDGEELTLLVSPMAGFYNVKEGDDNPGETQMRIAYVETPGNMKKVPLLFKELLNQFEIKRNN